MKRIFNRWTLTFLTLMVYGGVLFAQEKTITGTITDDLGEGIPEVQIEVKGKSAKAISDLDGIYSINAEEGDILIFTAFGLSPEEFVVGSDNVLDTQLGKDSAALVDEVVVAALGISREKKALGYAVQAVDGDILTEAGNQNALAALSGNAAGVQITAPSSMGGSVNIRMRGGGSVTGDNNPLIVVDGVPLDNSSANSTDTQRGGGGRDYGSAGFDVNPEDIEDMTILKGGPASAIYGSRGRNGVILITTKKGKGGKIQIELNSGVSFEQVAILPSLQTKYGAGAGSDTGLPSEFSKVTIDGTEYEIVDYGIDESWGPKYDPNRMVLHWDAFDPEFASDYMKPRAWVAPENDVESFFNTAMTTNNNISFSTSIDQTNVRVSLGKTSSTGIQPNSTLDRTTLSIGASSQFTDKLSVGTNLNYVRTDAFNRPEVGYGDNSVTQKFFQWGQRQLDMDRLQKYKTSDGRQRPWNRTAWDDSTPKYSDNPYWVINENTGNDLRNRYYGNVELKYQFSENFFTTGKIYADMYDFMYEERVAPGSQAQSSYTKFISNFSEFNYELMMNYTKDLTENLNLFAFAGGNKRSSQKDTFYGETQGGLAYGDWYNLQAGSEPPLVRENNNQLDGAYREKVNSVFGGVSLGFKDMLFLEATARNDWFSSLPANNNASFYPSFTGSFVFSKVLKADWLSFGKLRAGWSNVASGGVPHTVLYSYIPEEIFNGNSMLDIPTVVPGGEALGPENTATSEGGLEMSFFKNRLSFDATYYYKSTTDLVTSLDLDPSTGYEGKWVNAGEMVNQGVELMLTIVPIKSSDFQWSTVVNFSKNKNELKSLYGDLRTRLLINAPFGVNLSSIVGGSLEIMGTNFVYDAQGNKVIVNGQYKETNIESLGAVTPDYNAGIRNTFTYKNLDFSFLIDMQKGGKYFSTSHMWGMYSGMLEETAVGNIREQGIVLEGVNEDGSQNTTGISGQDYGSSFYTGPMAQNVYAADYWKLRDASIGYQLPSNWFNGTIEGIRLSAFGRNLYTWGLAYDGMDPEMASYGNGNIQGIEGGSLPSTRTYGFNAQIKF